MIQTPKTIRVEPGSEFDRALEEATETPIELEKSGMRYRVIRVDTPPGDSRVRLANEHDVWAGYDPERVRDGLQRSAGALRGVNRDQLLTDLAEQREQDSRSRPA